MVADTVGEVRGDVGHSSVTSEGDNFSPSLLSPAAQAILDDIDTIQSYLIAPSAAAAEGAGQPPQGAAAWSPDIQPFNISQAIKVTPGYGESYPTCGDVRYYETCPDDSAHHARAIFHRCHRSACPDCWPSWANRQGQKAAEAIEGYREAARLHRDARHVSMHPDPSAVPFTEPTPEALQWLYDEGRKAAAILGITAAAAIAHPYRFRSKAIAQHCYEEGQKEGKNRYEWATSQPNWAEFLMFSPHLHLEAYGPLMDYTQFHRKTGWTYRNHDDKTNAQGRRGAELRKTIFYLLSHAWVGGNNKVVRYWLGMSTHNLKRVDEGYQKMPVVCPVCSAPCIANPPDTERFDGTTVAIYQDLHNAPPALRKVLFHHYELRQRKRPLLPASPRPQGVIA